MDNSLKSHISSVASNLLFTSSEFEAYIPNSKQNIYHSLNLLSELGAMTQNSLQAGLAELKAQTAEPPKPSLSPTLSKEAQKQTRILTQPSSRTLGQNSSLKPLGKTAARSSTPSASDLLAQALAAHSTHSKERGKDGDQTLLDALQNLRESQKFQRKTMGVFSPILRAPLKK